MIRTEQQLLDAVVDLASLNRWAIHHDLPSRRARGQWRTSIQGHAGFPDLVLARAGVVLFRELKGFDSRGRLGKLSPEQRDWARQLKREHDDAYSGDPIGRRKLLFDVWTPDDMDDVIVPTLAVRAVVRRA